MCRGIRQWDLFFQMDLSWQNEPLALLILALMSFAVPLLLLNMLPRYLKSSTSSMMFCPKALLFIVITLVFFSLMFKPILFATSFSFVVLLCMLLILLDRRQMSSAKAKSSHRPSDTCVVIIS